MVPALGIPKNAPGPPSHYQEQWLLRFQVQARDTYAAFTGYFRHPACRPSFALALLYLTVLSFGGQMVTYLISAGFKSFYIGLVRSLSTVVELSATWIAPWLMKRMTPTRAAMVCPSRRTLLYKASANASPCSYQWFLNWQILWLAATIAVFWSESRVIVAASCLSAGTIMSRVGLWGYDLSAQVIIQTVSPISERVRRLVVLT